MSSASRRGELYALESLLRDTRGALRRAALLEGVLALGAGLEASVALGLIFSALEFSVAMVALIEIVVIAATLFFIGRQTARLVGFARHRPQATAAWLDRVLGERPEHRRDRVALLSAVEIARDRGLFGESSQLADAAIRDATQAVERIDPRSLVRRESRRAVSYRLLALGAASVVVTTFLVFAPYHLPVAFSAILALAGGGNPLAPALPEPRLGDIRIVLRYPAYTERSERSIHSGSGDIQALPGTEVILETAAGYDVSEASLLLTYLNVEEDSEGSGVRSRDVGKESRTAVQVRGRRLLTSFVVTRPGRYRFRLATPDGKILEERRGRAIELELDDPPEVTLVEPDKSPLEVNEKDRVSLVFSARDDFGLTEIGVAWRVLGSMREGRNRLTSIDRGNKRYYGQGQLDLASLDLKPGDRVAYTLEAKDNDTVSGPKIGASTTKELRVYSKAAHHREVLSLQEKALDELVHVLGDQLDAPVDKKMDAERYKQLVEAKDRINGRAFEIDGLLRETAKAIKKDPLGRKAVADAFDSARVDLFTATAQARRIVNGAKKELASGRAKTTDPDPQRVLDIRASQDHMVGGLERNVTYLADLLNDQRMIDAETLARDLREQQQALKKAIEAYKDAPDDQKRQLIAETIRDIKEQIKAISKELSGLKGTIPQEFVNREALSERDSEEALDRIQERIESGDLDGAMEELERMLSATEGMLSQLQEGREELENREYSEITEMAARLWKELEEVETRQRDLARHTEALSKDVLHRMKERLGDSGGFVELEKRRLEQVQKALERARPGSHQMDGDTHDQAERRLEDAMRALEGHDFGAAKDMLGQAAEHMEQLEQDTRRHAEQERRFGDFLGGGKLAERAEKELHRGRPILEEVVKDIERLTPSPESLLSDEERARVERYKQRQTELEDRAGKVGEQLERLGSELPIVGPEMKSIIGEARSAMGSAGERLGQADPPAALSHQRQAMEALARLRQELQKMAENGKGGGGGGGRGGVPLPFGTPAGGESRGDPWDQGDLRSTERVEIPKPDQYKAPTEFREDILEAAKQGTVESYRDAVRRYYEELVK